MHSDIIFDYVIKRYLTYVQEFNKGETAAGL